VMERTGLEVTHLTLEPIAALNVAIPKDLRLLNLALVDIGAGTSDIAITKAGTVIAYAMVPVAGDEVTEAIAQHYLVDFNTAEAIKLSMSSEESISFTDILDNKVTVKSQEVGEVVAPVVEQLARTITEKIYEYNGGKPPNAVFLVGGGSQVKGLCEALSQNIGLPKERVAVRNRSIAKNVVLEEDILNGPESITPLGILVTTGITKGQDFFYVTVNGMKVKMYNSRKMNVSDALMLAGFNSEQLICKSGKALKFKLNGADKTIRGSFGKPAEISVNEAVSSLNAIIAPGDDLKVIPAEKGQDGAAKVSDFVSDESVKLEFNGQTYAIMPRTLINGAEVEAGTAISEGDQVEITATYSLEDIAKQYEIDPLLWDFKVNGSPADIKTALKSGDSVACVLKTYKEDAGESKIEEEKLPEPTLASDFKAVLQEVRHKLAESEGITVIVNEKPVNLPPKSTEYMFIDIFTHIDFDLTTPKGVIMLRLNGKEANYTDIIKSGDRIDIYWRE
ncbi:MAG: rod shape-determining protein, partial [Clostridia bacterium]|nr:rod shape-determining protein [Clostridia bacterium]